jgi:hypothetical protein
MSATQYQERTTDHFSGGDADLLLRLRIALSVQKRAGWHLVIVAVHSGAVTLEGVVPSFYDRQLIASLVRHVAGVIRIDDNLAVGEPSLRQQVADAASAKASSEPASNTAGGNAFAHLPVLSESLDHIAPVSTGIARPAA